MNDYDKIIQEQKIVCKKFGLGWVESPIEMKIGISTNFAKGMNPVNGLRHPIENGTAGWYIWAGDYSEDPNFFVPMHIAHLEDLGDRGSLILKYLGLPPGSRFQIDETGYEDIWQDDKLLNI